MSRTATATNGLLWTWSDNDNPGAGTKGVTKAAGGTGLNANWETLDVSVGTEHNANGTHKNDVITGANLNSNVVDGSTLEVSSPTGTKVLRIKAAGVQMSHLNQAGATTGQAITWTGSAWAPGSPTPAVADSSITRAKLVQYLGGFGIDPDIRVAAVAPASVPAAETEWTETSASYVNKVKAFIVKRATQKYARLIAEIKSAGATVNMDIQLSAAAPIAGGSVSASASDASGAWTQVDFQLDISTLTDNALVEYTIEMRSASSTARFRRAVIFTDPV